MSEEAMANAVDREHPAPAPDFLSRLHKQVLLLTTLTISLTFSAGLSSPGPSWSDSDNGGVLGFLCRGSTAFVALLVLLLFLVLPPSTRRIKYWGLQVAMTLSLFAMIGGGTYIIGSWRAIALVAALLLYICIQLQLMFWRKWPEYVEAPRPYTRRRSILLLLAILAASIAYQAALYPPGAFWQDDAGARHDHVTGDTTIHSMNSWRHLVFFYCNAAVFVVALVVIFILLLGNIFNLLLSKTTKHLASQSALILSLFSLTGAYVAGGCRKFPEFIYISVLVVPVFLYVAIHVTVFMSQVFPVTWRQVLMEKVDQGVPGWLRMPFELPGEEERDEKRSKFVMLFATLAVTLTYHDGINPSLDNIVYFKAYFYCNSTAFVASLAIITVLINRKPARGISWHALRVLFILDLISLTGVYAAGPYRKASRIDVLILVLAVLLCIVFHVALSISGTARGFVQRLTSMLDLAGEEEDGSEDEMEFGISGGTDEEPLGLEISTPILEGSLTLILAVPVVAILENPVKLPAAMLIAFIGFSFWRRPFARLLRALDRALQRRCAVNLQGSAGSGASSARRKQLVSAICQGLRKVTHTLCTGTWVRLLILVICVPSLRDNLKLKVKMSKIVAVLGVLFVSAPTTAAATAMTDTPDTATATGRSTTAATAMNTPSTATSSMVRGNRAAPTAATTASGSRGEVRPTRNRRPNSRLFGEDWVN